MVAGLARVQRQRPTRIAPLRDRNPHRWSVSDRAATGILRVSLRALARFPTLATRSDPTRNLRHSRQFPRIHFGSLLIRPTIRVLDSQTVAAPKCCPRDPLPKFRKALPFPPAAWY